MYERMLDKKAEPSMPELVAHCGICGEGGWIHYRVTDREQLEDAKLLLRVKLGCLASGAQRRGRK